MGVDKAREQAATADLDHLGAGRGGDCAARLDRGDGAPGVDQQINVVDRGAAAAVDQPGPTEQEGRLLEIVHRRRQVARPGLLGPDDALGEGADRILVGARALRARRCRAGDEACAEQAEGAGECEAKRAHALTMPEGEALDQECGVRPRLAELAVEPLNLTRARTRARTRALAW